MIVDCATYVGGRRADVPTAIEGAHRRAEELGGFVWIGLLEPTEDEFAAVTKEFDLHELSVEDAIQAHQRPKLEVYDSTLFVVLKPARYIDHDEVVEFGEILLFIGERFILVVRHGEATELKTVRRSLEDRPDLLALGPSAVLHAIMDRIVDAYDPVCEGLAKDIVEVETEVFSDEAKNPTERIYFLKREVLEFQNAARPLTEPVARLMRGMVPAIEPDTHEYFRDVHDHLLRIGSHIEQYRDLLNSVLDANMTQVGVRQNEDMRKISAWVAVAVVPTLIAGIFGMNFSAMPGIHSSWGFPLVVVLMGTVAGTLYTLFRRSGWL
jgi:magnesium transporter